MVARIRTGKNIAGVVFYNEHKMENKKAVLLGGNNFIIDAVDLSSKEKISYFRKYTSLNQQTTVNALHISLNFHPTETFGDSKLLSIAYDYMKKIGFSEQPYLIYKHTDTAHPHIHIVSTNIRNDGSRISLHNLGRHQSETARKEIELEYGLKKAAKNTKSRILTHPASAVKVQQGKQTVKQAINNVLAYVLPSYKFCSLAELNAVLRLYNVVAERGSKNSLTYEKSGLLYFVTNEKGKRISAPIKASRFSMNPTLKNLERLFNRNEALRFPCKQQLKVAVDFALQKNPRDFSQLIADLKKERITLLPRINDQGLLYGITYIDHRSRCVFNGSDLGKSWSAKALCNRFHPAGIPVRFDMTGEKKETSFPALVDDVEKKLFQGSTQIEVPGFIPDAQLSKETIPFQLRKKRKTKKRRQTKL